MNEVSKSRHAKKIRIDGSSVGANQKIVFNDDGEVEDDMVHATVTGEDISHSQQLKSAKDNYLQRVRDRLTKTRELDRKEEKERIQEKHRKKRQKEKGELINDDDAEEEGGAVVTLGGQSDAESSDEEAPVAIEQQNLYDDESDSDEDTSDEDGDIKAQEELALSMLGA